MRGGAPFSSEGSRQQQQQQQQQQGLPQLMPVGNGARVVPEDDNKSSAAAARGHKRKAMDHTSDAVPATPEMSQEASPISSEQDIRSSIQNVVDTLGPHVKTGVLKIGEGKKLLEYYSNMANSLKHHISELNELKNKSRDGVDGKIEGGGKTGEKTKDGVDQQMIDMLKALQSVMKTASPFEQSVSGFGEDSIEKRT